MTDSHPAAASAYSLTRVLDAPRSLVWQAWTEPAHIARWWGPHGCAVVLDEADRHPGGRFRREMQTTGGGLVVVTGTFEEVVPERRIVTIGVLERPGSPPLKTRMTVTFEDLGDKTELTIVQSSTDFEPDYAANANVGWAQAFEKLDALLASERGRAG